MKMNENEAKYDKSDPYNLFAIYWDIISLLKPYKSFAQQIKVCCVMMQCDQFDVSGTKHNCFLHVVIDIKLGVMRLKANTNTFSALWSIPIPMSEFNAKVIFRADVFLLLRQIHCMLSKDLDIYTVYS